MLRPVFGWRWHESPIFSSTPPGGIRLTSRASRHRGPSRSRQPASPPVRAKRVAAVAFCLASLLAPLGRAQFFDRLSNPTVTVDIRHPPSLGLQVDRLVFGPAAGECSDQIIAAMVDDFVSNGIEVVDRRNLDLILAEHDFAFSGYVDRASAARIGRILGPSAMLIVDVQRCAVEKKRFRDTVTRYDRKTKTEYEQPVYSSRTRGFVKASIRTVDLATGRIFAARTLDYAPVRESESYEGYPEYPSEYDVLDAAFGRAVRDARRMFLPWTEKTGLIFYDDKACGLKGAYQALKAGMLEQALEVSTRNLEACKAAPRVRKRTLARAHYNVGMSNLMLGRHDAALEHLLEAAELRPGDVVAKAIADTRRAGELLASMRELEEDAALEVAKRDAAAERAVEARTGGTLTNEDVVGMTEQKLSEAIILRKMQTSNCRFDTSADALVALTKAGVSENVVMAMMDAQ